VLGIVLTREDANTEFALLAEWLVEDRAEVAHGQPVCVVETTKATVEVEAPGDLSRSGGAPGGEPVGLTGAVTDRGP